MRSFKDFNLVETVALTPAQLKGDSSAGKYKGESRPDILIKLIKLKTPLELAKGGTFTVTDIEGGVAAVNQFKKDGMAFTLRGDNDTFISSSKLGKSELFGGGGGSGGGSLSTKITECHNAVICYAMLDHGMQNEDYFKNDDILKAAYKQVDVDAKLDDILAVEDDWFHSSYVIAEALVKGGYIKKGHTFHRNSKLMQGIYKAKNLAYKNSGQSAMMDDKWNPGDIWACTSDFKLKDLNTENVAALNKTILQLFVDRKLVGISLKKIVKNLKMKEFNVKLPPDTDDHKVLKILTQGEKRGTFWSAKGITIVFDEGKMSLRDGTPGGAIKGEIILKTARGGGAGWGEFSDGVKQVFRKNLPKHKAGVYKYAKGIAKKRDKKGIKIFWTMFNNFYKNVSYEEFEKELFKKDTNWLSAKLASLYVAYYVDINMGRKANRFITKIVNYAGSKAEDSSAYVKVYE
jgi:hypothetical protein